VCTSPAGAAGAVFLMTRGSARNDGVRVQQRTSLASRTRVIDIDHVEEAA
jgi:hypothetical protein